MSPGTWYAFTTSFMAWLDADPMRFRRFGPRPDVRRRTRGPRAAAVTVDAATSETRS